MAAHKDPHSRNLRQNRVMDGPGTFFITKNLEPKKRVLSGEMLELIGRTWCHYADSGRLYLAAFAIMPDHYHVLFGVDSEGSLSQILQAAQRWIGRHTDGHLEQQGCIWQDGFYDTKIRSSKQFLYVRNYIEANPVRARFVEHEEEWLWSSANKEHKKHLVESWPWEFEKDLGSGDEYVL